MSLKLPVTSEMLQEFIDDFLNHFLKSKSLETKGTYRRALREFQRFCAGLTEPLQFQESEIEAYKQYLIQTRGLSEVSISTYLTALRRLMEYLISIGVITENPARQIKASRPSSKPVISYLTEPEVQKLLLIVPTLKVQDRRDRLMIRLMIEAGLTENELAKSLIGDLKKFSTHYVLFLKSNNRRSKEETADISIDLGLELEEYLELRKSSEPESPLFASHSHRVSEATLTTRAIRYRIDHWLKVAGLNREGITPHSLRHTAAYLWIHRDKLSLPEVQRRLRHGMLSTTKNYYKFDDLSATSPSDNPSS
ncbi:MAG: tyrosine-type recombinase/integrase [Chloroherpetonaceae bacterium]|nr:tyrosine-type recombinase/integrase [Chloroherpetonaceae bacterium]